MWHILAGMSQGILLNLFSSKMHVFQKIKKVIREQPLCAIFRASSVLWYQETMRGQSWDVGSEVPWDPYCPAALRTTA